LHLSVGSQKANIEDKVAKKRQAKGESHGMSHLTEDNIREIRKLHEQGESKVNIGHKFNVGRKCISHIILGDTWSHVI
jgi:IS30 family transposase